MLKQLDKQSTGTWPQCYVVCRASNQRYNLTVGNAYLMISGPNEEYEGYVRIVDDNNKIKLYPLGLFDWSS